MKDRVYYVLYTKHFYDNEMYEYDTYKDYQAYIVGYERFRQTYPDANTALAIRFEQILVDDTKKQSS